ncbi:MAG: hypothetical protein PHH47_10055 [Gallionella sp.]|nr:hypothetical protein [Gallionella sp.]MDD4946443.1 hypothetical protein [Gallionella sp.]
MRDAILKALDGSSSQNPVNVSTLDTLGDRQALSAALAALRDSGEINAAEVTRGGVCSALVWRTGIINPPIHGHFRDMPRLSEAVQAKKRAEVAAHLKNINEKEKEMHIGTSAVKREAASEVESLLPVTREQLCALVAVHPGIKRDDVMRRFVQPDGSNKRQAVKLITNAIAAGALRQNDADGVLTLHPGAKRREYHPQKAPHTPPAAAVAPAEPPRSQRSPDTQFGLMLSDTYHLHITVGDEVISLNPAQLQRLDQFLASVLPDGVRA